MFYLMGAALRQKNPFGKLKKYIFHSVVNGRFFFLCVRRESLSVYVFHCGLCRGCAVLFYIPLASLSQGKVLIMKPIYTCCRKHVDTHIIYIMHLCTFPWHYSLSLFCSLKQTHTDIPTHPHACRNTHTHTHMLSHMCKYTESLQRVMQRRGQERDVNSRESGRGVGGVWEDHMHFTRH